MNQAVTACVIIIGNEILSGRTQDINLNHIASTLGGWGIQVHHARVIPDDEDIIVNTINEVRKAYNYVFTTGGIGPTHDDITAVCVAKAFDVPIIQHPDITDDVAGFLNVDSCNDLLEKIARLPNKNLTETLNPVTMSL